MKPSKNMYALTSTFKEHVKTWSRSTLLNMESQKVLELLMLA